MDFIIQGFMNSLFAARRKVFSLAKLLRTSGIPKIIELTWSDSRRAGGKDKSFLLTGAF
jgi:hypothetical protein